MPPLCLHLAIAEEAAERLNHPVIQGEPGGYLIGATLPDVHLISSLSREETHFFKLENPFGESGVTSLFRAYPYLADKQRLEIRVKAIVAGYLSHLITDEIWIRDIYHPYFSAASPLAGNPMSNLLDRVLQYELDCQTRQDREKMARIQDKLCRWDPEVPLGFLQVSVLRQWQEFICLAASREPSWERFALFAHKFLLPQHKVDPARLEEFLHSVPQVLEQLFQYIPLKQIQDFREKAVTGSIKAAKEYLDESDSRQRGG